jgi:putative transposase
MTTVKRHRHSSEQAVRRLREGERLLGEGMDLAEVLRHLEIAESTWNRWRGQYGGMKASGAKRLKEFEGENARLKKLLAEAELDKAMLKELAEGEWCPRIVAAAPWWCCRDGSGFRSARHAGWWVSTARRNADQPGPCRPTVRSCDAGSAGSPGGIPVWVGVRPTMSSDGRASW